ncbi:LCP family protein [Frankia sp. AgB32]|uniref:LCP family protein n=1 Tax=Frankia sp. AgB32 TaxID=631119 RepID=UPI00200E5560|nr:LCP family protein [Frankia sp. AgB32]MCK9896701.1 LCP family protein [Frankia sp. AgB32]
MTAPHLEHDSRVLPARLDPRGSGPGRAGRGAPSGFPPRRRRRGLLAFLAFLSTSVLVVTVGGWAAYAFINGKVNRINLGLGSSGSSALGVANYLLVGTDDRPGLDGQRSDTTILAHLDKDGTTTMISFPRDTYVTIPEYTDAAGKHHAATKDKFNSAISSGGPALLVQTVQSLTGMQVDHYLSMNLLGFKTLTDAVGGVQVCIKATAASQHFQDDDGRWRTSTNTNDPMSGFVGGPGTIEVNGDQALAFVRQRHGLPAGDTDRIARQQQFIGAMFHKIMSGDTLTNPVKVERLTSAAASALTLDDHTQLTDLRALATRLHGLASGGIRMQTVPTHAPTRAEGAVDDLGDIKLHGVRASVQFYRPDDLARLVTPLGGKVEGATPTDDTSGGVGPSLAAGVTAQPSQVRVAVLNGSSRAGLASKVVSELTAKGFRARSSGNASALTHETSRVIYGTGQEAEARTVAAAVPGSTLLPDSTVTGVQLVLGSSFTEVVTPTAATASTAPASTATTAAPAPPAAAAPATPATETPSCTY